MHDETNVSPRWIVDDKEVTQRVEWRIPQVGERYFRAGTDHVATLRRTRTTPRWVVLDSLSGNNPDTPDGSGRFTVENGVRKVRLTSRSWL